MDTLACDDLKAFERRLTEVISSYKPSALRWRILLSMISLGTAIGAWYWLRDPHTTFVPLTQSLSAHPIFALALVTLIVLFVLGIHNQVKAPQIITNRVRLVLADFNMSCDENGKLILKLRQSNDSN